MDQICDIYNMVHACEIANQAEKDIAIRRASGFNELFEAAVKKEHALQTDLGLGFTQDQDSRSGATGKGKEKQPKRNLSSTQSGQFGRLQTPKFCSRSLLESGQD